MAEGTVWDEIFAVLKERAAAGVEIHLIIDDFGTLTRLSDGTLQAIKDAGIEVEIFNPVHRYINRLYFNYRDHRKITVIDGYVAYAGGINIGDEYANRIERFGYWKDSTVRLTGDGVGRSKRQEIKFLLRELKKTNPNIEKSIFQGINGLQLDTFPGFKHRGVFHSFPELYNHPDWFAGETKSEEISEEL